MWITLQAIGGVTVLGPENLTDDTLTTAPWCALHVAHTSEYHFSILTTPEFFQAARLWAAASCTRLNCSSLMYRADMEVG
jgi:hypothetical protein